MQVPEFAQFCSDNGFDGFDVIYGSHALCTCKWVANPLGFSRRGGGVTCGGLRIEPEAVRQFVQGVARLLTPDAGVAIFDQEGGWPFGLEELLREEAKAANLFFYVRRGPLFTNFDYILSNVPLDDDVKSDPLQVTARATDTLSLLIGL